MAIEEIEIWPKATGILDLPADWTKLAQTELRVIATQWAAKRADSESSQALGTAIQELEHEWAIETGQIENLYEIGWARISDDHSPQASSVDCAASRTG